VINFLISNISHGPICTESVQNRRRSNETVTNSPSPVFILFSKLTLTLKRTVLLPLPCFSFIILPAWTLSSERVSATPHCFTPVLTELSPARVLLTRYTSSVLPMTACLVKSRDRTAAVKFNDLSTLGFPFLCFPGRMRPRRSPFARPETVLTRTTHRLKGDCPPPPINRRSPGSPDPGVRTRPSGGPAFPQVARLPLTARRKMSTAAGLAPGEHRALRQITFPG